MRFVSLIIILIPFLMNSQKTTMDTLPYHQIPEYPEEYSSGSIISRMIDGLGYRFYWATEGLTEKDLAYQSTKEARTTYQTIQHIHGLAETILKTSQKLPNIRPYNIPEHSFKDLRMQILTMLQSASQSYLTMDKKELAALSVVFQNGDRTSEFPFWNLINGQIADAIYHTGQIVSFRRISGNPLSSGVNVFMGKTRE